MTTIAWDGKLVAVDSQRTRNGDVIVSLTEKKFRIKNNVVYVFMDTPALFKPMVSWVENGANSAIVPKDAPGSDSTLFVFEHFRCIKYATDMPYPDEYIAPDAWGRGYEFALGALLAGANATRAIEIASLKDVYTGGSVRTIALTTLKEV
jgi:hypothetical protein